MPVGYTNLTRALQLSGNPTIDGGILGVAAGQSLRLAGDITGTGVLGLGGRGGTFTLAGTNSHSGGISVVGDQGNPATLFLDSDFTGPITLGDAQAALPAVLGSVADGSLGDAANIVTLGSSYFDGERTIGVQGGLRAYADLELAESRRSDRSGCRARRPGYPCFGDRGSMRFSPPRVRGSHPRRSPARPGFSLTSKALWMPTAGWAAW